MSVWLAIALIWLAFSAGTIFGCLIATARVMDTWDAEKRQ